MHFVFFSLISLVKQWKIMLHLALNTWSAASKALTLSVKELMKQSDVLQCNSLLGICNVCVGRLYWAVTLTAYQTVTPPSRNWLAVNARRCVLSIAVRRSVQNPTQRKFLSPLISLEAALVKHIRFNKQSEFWRRVWLYNGMTELYFITWPLGCGADLGSSAEQQSLKSG